MKKIGMILIGALALGAVSCSNDEPVALEKGKTIDVTFEASLPDGTRATETNFGNGTTATKLYYAIYTADGSKLVAKDVVGADFDAPLRTSVTVQLVTGNSYKAIFWAQAPGAPYTFTAGETTAAGVSVTADYTSVANNNESLDAFYVCKDVTIDDSTQIVSLERPFAQLNIATSDKAAVEASNSWPTQSSVTLTHIPNTLNLLDGAVSGDATVTLTTAALPNIGGAAQTISVDGTTYDYLSLSYVFAPNTGSALISDVTMTVDKVGQTNKVYQNIPLRANYRTNIIGNLLTKSTEFIVTINPIFDGYENVNPNLSTWNGTDKTPVTPTTTTVGGESVDLYPVNNAAELAYVLSTPAIATDEDAYIQLNKDFDMSGVELPAIAASVKRGDSATPGFQGTFDGNGHTISNLKIAASTEDKYGNGLIAVASNATIKDITLDSPIIGSSGDFSAAVLGLAASGEVTVSNCHVVNPTLEAAGAAAGIVGRGYAADNTVTNCSVTGATVTAPEGEKTAKLAGIMGVGNNNVTITNCTVDATTVIGTSETGVGGILGHLSSGAKEVTISNCQTAATVGSTDAQKNCKYAGGVVGYFGGKTANITNCSNSGAINATVGAGGIIGNTGNNWQHPVVTGCSNSGTITCLDVAGGIAGGNAILATDCKNTGKVIAGTMAGGIIGYCTSADADVAETGIINCSGGTAEITASKTGWAGRLIGGLQLKSTTNFNTAYMRLEVNDANGDVYSSLPTIGSMPPWSVAAVVKVMKGTFHGNPAHGTPTKQARVIIDEGAAWDLFPGQTGTWQRIESDDWTKL